MRQIVRSCLCFLMLYSTTAVGQLSRSKNKTSVAYRNSYQHMAVGDFHTLEIRNGTLWTWGYNSYGQLGTGNTTNSNVPVQVGGDNKWISVAAGANYSLALKSDGTLWAWGENDRGQLGNGNTTNATTPQQVGGDNKWVSITGGGSHSLGLKSDGTLWAWGYNGFGQLGIGNTISSSTPQQVGGDNRWVSVTAGYLHNLALKSDGTLWAWGRNNSGQLGIGNTTNVSTPQQVGTDNKWVSAAGGGLHSLALKSDGTLWAWGGNGFGQLGIGNTISSSTPQQVGGDNKWVSVAPGVYHSLALKSDGTLWAWGENDGSQFDTDGTNDAFTPQQVGGDNKWVSVVGGALHSLTVKSDGTLWTWGNNAFGQLGTGNTINSNVPVQVGGDTKWVTVATGAEHSLALKSNGTLWAWGRNNSGQLGIGSTTDAITPQQLGGDNKWVSVAAGAIHSLALKSDGTLWAWGDNGNGRLGTGNGADAAAPRQVEGENKWISVAAGVDHSLALKSDGTLWAWGYNGNGRLGTGNGTNIFTPHQIGTDNKWISVAGGGNHNLALKSDGTLWAWGLNDYGQLGTGNPSNFDVPVQIGGDKWVSVAAGIDHNLALKSDGTLWAWGLNNSGQLGNGNTTNVFIPQQVGTDNNWVSAAAGVNHNLALKSNGTLWAWGNNSVGQLGTGNTTSAFTPQQVGTDVVTMAVGGLHSALIHSNRSTICLTGRNNYGQLGTGTTTDQSTFTCLFTNSSTNSIATSFSTPGICAGATITLPYTVVGTYNPGNSFTAQLSNATGSFASPLAIGSVSSVNSGTITATIPVAIPAGTVYRIRVISSFPAVVGTDNGANIMVNAIPATPAVVVAQPSCTVATVNIMVNSPTGAGITYSIDNTNYQVSNFFSSVAPGNYNVTAKNSSGCVSAATPVTVNAGPTDNQPPSIALKPNPTIFLTAANTYTVQLSDVLQSVSDNCDPNPNATISTLQVNCSNLGAGSSGDATPHQAYVSDKSVGNANYDGQFGLTFKVNSASGVVIDKLGAFDDQSNGTGITGSEGGGVRVAIFNRTTQAMVPGLDVTIVGATDPLVGNYRMRSITPVILPAGNYVIVTKGYVGEKFYNRQQTGPLNPAGDHAGDALTFLNTVHYGSTPSFSFPAGSADGGNPNEYIAGTFNYALSVGGGTPHQAYVSDKSVGNANYDGQFGLTFKVNNASGVVIDKLGAFDDQSNGTGISGNQSGGVRVAIFNQTTQAMVPGLDVTIVGASDPLVGNYRMRTLATPVTLPAGNYVIVTKGYVGEKFYNRQLSGPLNPAGDNAGDVLTFLNTVYYGSTPSFSFPTGSADGGNPNEYIAGTFNYSLSAGNSVTVTARDASGNISTATTSVTVIDTFYVLTTKNATVNLNASGQATIVPADVLQSLKNNCGVDVTTSTFQVSPSTFTCADIGGGVTPSAIPHQAYVSNQSIGNANYDGQFGLTFKVNDANGIIIDKLGAFDDQSNGTGIAGNQSGGVRVAIFNQNTQAMVPGLDVTIVGAADPLVGNYRMRSITPVILPAGNYVIVTKGYVGEKFYNRQQTGSLNAAGDNAGGAISFLNTVYFGSGASFNFPAGSADGGNPNEYIAGTFNYKTLVAGGEMPHQAYVSNQSIGNANYDGQFGLTFKVNNANGIIIDKLGAFDDQSNGTGISGNQSGGVRVAIFNRNTQAMVPGLDVTIVGATDPLVGNYRMRSITPITLPAGNYVIVTKGYVGEKFYNRQQTGPLNPAGDHAGDALTFLNTVHYGSTPSFSFPAGSADGGNPNEYIAGTFNYALNTSNTKTVIITATDIHGYVTNATASVTLTNTSNSCTAAPAPVMTYAVKSQQTDGFVVLDNVNMPIKVYPNPSTGQFTVQLFNLKVPKLILQIMDANGKVIEEKTAMLTGKTPTLTIPVDISKHATGIYLIKIISADGVQTTKVVLSH